MNSTNSKEPINNINDLRHHALALLNDVIDGKSDDNQINLFCKLANTILTTFKVQLEVIKLESKNNNSDEFMSENKKLR